MRRSPLIAITATTVRTGAMERVQLNAAYTRAVAAAGGIPVAIAPLAPHDAESLIARVDGLLLSGGQDVDPARYGAMRHDATHDPNAARDESEIALVNAARARKLPTLAICRGVQILNVALGGTLVQDIPSEVRDALPHAEDGRRAERLHEVAITNGSRLARIVDAMSLRVNTLHHQSIARVADSLAINAVAPDGVVEGAEWPSDDWWCVGVQWHPEELTETEEAADRTLFAAFIAAATPQSPPEAPNPSP